MKALPKLVINFDGLLDPTFAVQGWFEWTKYSKQPVVDAITFIIDATEFYDIYIHSPRSYMPSGIQVMQCAIIFWTTMEVNSATMHDLMAVLHFPSELPKDYAVFLDYGTISYGTDKGRLDPDAVDFIETWHSRLINNLKFKKELP